MAAGKRPALIMFFAVISLFAAPAYTADGPQNTGSLMLGAPSGSDQKFEAQLSIDGKVLTATFGDNGRPEDVLQLFTLALNGAVCNAGTPSVISSADVVTAALSYQCAGSASSLSISLSSDNQIPEGFTLGVRTPFDHFVLSKDSQSRDTITSGALLFFRAGLVYFTGGAALENARIGRAHALFYGGLAAVPPGAWLLLLVLAVWLGSFSTRVKILLTALALVITAVTATVVMQKQASLSLIPVRPLGFIYLGLIALLGATVFIPREKIRALVQTALLAVTSVASGLEHAVILRWLEGQQDISIPMLTASFFLGTAISITLIIAVVYATISAARNSAPVSDMKKSAVFTALPLFLLAGYPAVVMLLKII